MYIPTSVTYQKVICSFSTSGWFTQGRAIINATKQVLKKRSTCFYSTMTQPKFWQNHVKKSGSIFCSHFSSQCSNLKTLQYVLFTCKTWNVNGIINAVAVFTVVSKQQRVNIYSMWHAPKKVCVWENECQSGSTCDAMNTQQSQSGSQDL